MIPVSFDPNVEITFFTGKELIVIDFSRRDELDETLDALCSVSWEK